MTKRSSVLSDLQGVVTAIATPFDGSGEVDHGALAALVQWQIASGVRGLAPCGTTGEGATLTDDEHAAVIETVARSASGRVPVIAGVGSNATRKVLQAARRAREAGADALLVVSPYYNKPNRSGLIEHYRAVCEATPLPVMVYNVPGRTGQNLSAELTLELSAIPGIDAVKEAAADLAQMQSILAGRPHGFRVFSGDDDLALAAMAYGADGVVSVASNEAPGPFSELASACLSGDLERARTIHFRLLPLLRANFAESNPVPVKVALEMLGKCPSRVRAPLGPASEPTRARVAKALAAAGLIEEAGA